MFKRNLSLVIAAMLGAVLIACGSTDTAKTTKKADTENTEAVTELAEDTQSEETALTETQDNTETADGTAADSEKQQDSSSDTKSSEKDSTSAKQETAGKDKAASTAKTDSGKKSAQSSGASNQTKPASAAGSKGTDSSSGTANKPAAHTHTWVKYVANTIQHKEEGHYETKVVKAAYDEPKYEEHNVCNKCGYDMGTDDWAAIEHYSVCDGSYSCIPVQVGTIHHDAVTEQVYVVDQAAYTEYVYGEKCSVCGATK